MKTNVLTSCFVCLIGASLLTGCASVPKASSDADGSAKQFQTTRGNASIYIFRKPAAVGSAVAVQIAVNGRVIGSTGAGTFFLVSVEPGTHSISSFTAESAPSLSLTVEPGKLYFVEQRTHFGLAAARSSLQQVSESEGRAAVLRCRLLVGAY